MLLYNKQQRINVPVILNITIKNQTTNLFTCHPHSTTAHGFSDHLNVVKVTPFLNKHDASLINSVTSC